MFWVLFAVALLCAAFIGAKLMDNLWQYQIKDLRDWRANTAAKLHTELGKDPEMESKGDAMLTITVCDQHVHVLDDLLLARRRHFR